MEKPKLDLNDLDVTSFVTSGYEQQDIIRLPPTTDPTAATRCFICPPITYDCQYY